VAEAQAEHLVHGADVVLAARPAVD
jgi:hypothetical protein